MGRDVYIKSPENQRNPGKIWKLKNLLYGLNDANGKFWHRVKETLLCLGLNIMNGDDGFYYRHEDNELQGAVLKLNDFQFLELIISWKKILKGIS